MLVIYPNLKRVERYQVEGGGMGAWNDTLALLEAGFPRSQEEIEARFKVVSQRITNGMVQFLLQPRSTSARKLVAEVKMEVNTHELVPRATELRFADGSVMRNEFLKSVINPPLDSSLFQPAPDSSYKVIEPIKR
jgi:outer membrane lipoprotein-sorting protein